MERSVLILFFVSTIALSFTISSAAKLGHCNDACKRHEDCFGKLACMKGNKCNDDPDLKTRICHNSKLGHCGSSCHKHEDCRGKLACFAAKHSHAKTCGDDPFMKTHICKSPSAPGPKPAMGPLPAMGPWPFPAFGPLVGHKYPKHHHQKY